MNPIANAIDLPRWMPAFAVGGAPAPGVLDRLRPTPPGDGPPLTPPGMSGDDEGRRRGEPEGGGSRAAAGRFGGAPDPSGNAGGRLDLFA